MKLHEMTIATVDICVGYDDHCTVRRVDHQLLGHLLTLKTADQINDFIINHGQVVSNDCGRGDIFFDMMNRDITELRQQVQDYAHENQ